MSDDAKWKSYEDACELARKYTLIIAEKTERIRQMSLKNELLRIGATIPNVPKMQEKN